MLSFFTSLSLSKQFAEQILVFASITQSGEIDGWTDTKWSSSRVDFTEPIWTARVGLIGGKHTR